MSRDPSISVPSLKWDDNMLQFQEGHYGQLMVTRLVVERLETANFSLTT